MSLIKKNLDFKLAFILILISLLFLSGTAFAQKSPLRVGIINPLRLDNKRYDGLDKFIKYYLQTYINQVNNIKVVDNYDANKLFESKFRKTGIDEVYSGFLSQMKLYMPFDLLLVSELSTVIDENNENKEFIRLNAKLIDTNAEVITSFKITISDIEKSIKYLNQSIEYVVKKIADSNTEFSGLSINQGLKEKLESNIMSGIDFSFTYYFIEGKNAKNLYQEEGTLISELHNYGFSNNDISKGFMKRYLELKMYSRALSYGLGLIKEKYESDSLEVFINTAEELFDAHLFKATTEILKAAITYKDLSDPIDEFLISREMGKAYLEGDRITEAEPFITVCEDTSSNYGYFPYYLESLSLYSYLYARIGLYERSQRTILKLEERINEIDSKLWNAYFYYYKGKSYAEMSLFDQAMEYTLTAEKLLLEFGEYEKLIKNYIVKAKIYKDKMEYEEANQEIRYAMEYAIKTKNYLYIKTVNDFMHEVAEYSKERAYVEADEIKFMEIYKKHLKNIHNRFFLRCIVHLFNYLKEYEKSIELMQKVVLISEELESDYYLYKDYYLLGSIYTLKDDKDLAFVQYAESLTYTEKIGNPIYQFYPLIKLAELFKLRGNIDNAIATYEAIAESGSVYGILTLTEEAYYQISLIYKEMGDNDKFIEYSRKAFRIGKILNSFNVDIYNEPLKGSG